MGFFGRKKDISNMVFDWDAYWDDIKNDVDFDARMRKMKNNGYYVDKYDVMMQNIPVADYAK